MDDATRRLVRERADFACEYCRMPQAAAPFIAFHIEHIIARQHLDEDKDDPNCLPLACDRCNAFKGPNIASIDPETGEMIRLFHPRFDEWGDHFELLFGAVQGLTSVGRATARLLNMNDQRRVELRHLSLRETEDI